MCSSLYRDSRQQNGQGIPTIVRVVEDRLLRAHEMFVKKRLIFLASFTEVLME
jgi:hypothetical protein